MAAPMNANACAKNVTDQEFIKIKTGRSATTDDDEQQSALSLYKKNGIVSLTHARVYTMRSKCCGGEKITLFKITYSSA